MPPSTSPTRALAATLAAALTALTLSAVSVPAHADTSRASASTPPLTAEQASIKARSTNTAVPVDAATTATNQLTANPDGSFTLNQALTPVRKIQGGTWKPLDSTLVKRSDGTIGPALTTSDLTLSSGGSGPLAVMKTGTRSLSLTLPSSLTASLPAPTLAGPSATYSLMTGIDLKVTADTQGGFSEVLVIKDATAAANPALKSLAFTTRTTGVDLAADTAGNITAKDTLGKVLFSAPAPVNGEWDSSVDTSAPTVTDPTTGATLDAHSGSPAQSSPAGPGATAHTAPIKAAYSNGSITLTPDPALLSGQNTVWPLYIDPTYSAGGGWAQAWTYVNSYYSGTSYWNTSDSEGLRVGYNGWSSPYYVGRAFAQMNVPSSIYGATITYSRFYATETWSPSCTASNVELWSVGSGGQQAITSGTTWNNQPSWSGWLDTQSAAHGYSSSCPNASVGFNTTSLMQSAANSSWSMVTLGLKASNESDANSWKKFQPSTMYMSTTYDHAPNTPNPLSTSPSTACTANPPTVIGNGDVTLYAGVSDPDGGSLGVAFTLVNTSTGATVASTTTSSLYATSGTTASLTIPRTTMASAAGGALTTFSWNVYTSDGTFNSPTSATCKFVFDPTVPGAPTITQNATSYTVGTSASFTFTANATGSTPASFLYQLNGAAPHSVTPTSGSAQVSIAPTRGVNTLTVTSVSSGGNIGNTANLVINAAAPATAVENDLSGAGHADLALVGGQNALPSGLWLAPGTASYTVNSAATNIGALGTGLNSNGSPKDWDGTQVAVGHFKSGGGFNDILDYNANSGVGHILYGNGDGSALSPYSGAQANVASNVFQLTGTTAHASHVASGGNLYNTANGNAVTGYPDLLLTLSGHLYLEPAMASPGLFVGADSATDLSDLNPTGTGDWTGWTITSSLVNGLPALFARSDTGGQLYYYDPTTVENLLTASGSISPVQLASSGWDATSKPVIQAADINGDGNPDLWAITSTGAVTTYLSTGSALTTQTTQVLTAPTHTWALNDNTIDGATASTAADTTSSATMSGTGTMSASNGSGPATIWHTGDLYTPDLLLNTNASTLVPDSGATGTLTTTGFAVDTTKSFTVDVWAKPTNYGGVLVSEDATNASTFIIYPENVWHFGMASVDDNSWSYDLVDGPQVTFGAWTHVTVVFNASNSTMYMYINGQLTGTATHTARIATTNSTRISGYKYQGAQAARYSGQIANLRTYAQALDGTQTDTQRAANNTWGTANTVSAIPNTQAVTAAGMPNGDTAHITLAGGTEYAQWQHSDGTWSAVTPIDTTQTDGTAVTNISAIAATADGTGMLQILSLTGGTLHHQTWTAATGWSKDDVPPGGASGVTAIAAAGLSDGTAQFMSVIGGVEYHQIRNADRTWSNFNQLGNSGVTAVAAASLNDGTAQFMSVVGGVEYHQIRYTSGSWSAFNQLGNSGVTAVAATGNPDGSTQFVSVSGNAASWQMRNPDGTWTAFTQEAASASGASIAGYLTATTTNPWYNTTHLITIN